MARNEIRYVSNFYSNIIFGLIDKIGNIIGLLPEPILTDVVGRAMNVNMGDTVYITERSYNVDGVQYTEAEYKIVNSSGEVTFHDVYLFAIYD